METNEKQDIRAKSIGTSWHGNEFLATVQELKQAFGEPDELGTEDDKVQYEWILDLGIAVITIYDWKQYRNYNEDKLIKFHIGGHSSDITKLAQGALSLIVATHRNKFSN